MAGKTLPITLGVYAPQAVIDREPDGRVSLRPLVLDEAAAIAANRAAFAAGQGWMPENEFAFLAPGAPVLIAASPAALADAIAALPARKWHWGE